MNRHNWPRVFGSIVLLVLFLAGGGPSGAAAGQDRLSLEQTWVIETVDSEGDVGWSTSLALDAGLSGGTGGHPHISYHGAGLKYAYHDGSAWQIETVDSEGSSYSSLVLDVAGKPHIAYHGAGLKYAYHDGSAWVIETVDSEGSVGWEASLALDSAGRPHISYCAYVVGQRAYHCVDLKYAYHDGSAWHVETVDSAGTVGGDTSLALDAADRPHISYFDQSNADLKYAYHDGSAWQIETVDSEGLVGSSTSLALDAAGRPHISYFADSPNYAVRYAHHDGSAWQIETVDGGHVGQPTSLALDATGRPHIAYGDYGNDDLKYAYHGGSGSAGTLGSSFGTANGSGWQVETVDSEGEVGGSVSLALNAWGWPHISYYDRTNGDLKYAYSSGQPFADPAFRSVWQRTDQPIAEGFVARSWMWGPAPLTTPLYEPYAESPGGSRLVQYFDKSRMEINDPSGDRSSPWFVTNGLLVRELVEGRVQVGDAVFEERTPAQEAVAGDPAFANPICPVYGSFSALIGAPAENRLGRGVTATLAKDGTVGEDPSKGGYAGTEIAYYEEATGHNVPQALWDFMNQHGLVYAGGSYRTEKVVDWLFAMGYPISEPYWTRCTVAGVEKDVLVQLFERRVLTYTPSNPEGWRVEMGNVGRHYYDWRYQ